MKKVLCFKLYTGQILIAYATEIFSIENGDQADVNSYELTNIRVLGIVPNPNNPDGVYVRLMPYILGAADPKGVDSTPVRLTPNHYHIVYDPEKQLEDSYIQDVSGIVLR